MNFLSGVLPTLIVLGVLITIHELGHFIACRLFKVKVEKFSIGFGPEIFHWQGKETRYAISLLPLGGFVKPAGESASEVEAAGGPKPGDYLSASLPGRFLIVIAGVVMNYLLAYVLFVTLFMAGRPVPGTTIGGLMQGYPAETSGLRLEDKVLAINGQKVKTWADMLVAIDKSQGEVQLLVERQKNVLALAVQPKVDEMKNIFGEKSQMKLLGIRPDPRAGLFERFGPIQSLRYALEAEISLAVMTHKAIFFLIMGKLSMQMVSGPIGIIAVTGSAAKLGIPYLLQLAANLSVSLAVINLIPIPGLDGGHLFFLLIEAVRRKQVNQAAQEKATQVGFALLLVFAAFVIYSDIAKLDVVGKVAGLFNRMVH